MRSFLFIVFLVITIPAEAEQIVCSENGRLSRYEGDCYKLGICQGFNNSQIRQGCIIANSTEYQNAGDKYYKLDPSIVVGNRVVEMTAQEKNDLDAQELSKKQARQAAKDSVLDDDITKVRNVNLTKVDKAIDNIGNLDDAKAFLKKLCRYIASTR